MSTIKIVSWNVRRKNKHIKTGLDWILKQNPDVVCLQEVPQPALSNLEQQPNFHLQYVEDFVGTKKISDNMYLAILAKNPIKSYEVSDYSNIFVNSLLSKYANYVGRVSEKYFGLTVSIELNNQLLSVTNLHLSCATGSAKRLLQLQSALVGKSGIICGDFNLLQGNFFQYLTGFTLNYNLADYKINEAAEAEKIFLAQGLQNPLKNTKTTMFPALFGQLDYILLDNRFTVIKSVVGDNFGSDHKVVICDAQVQFASN